MGVEDALDCAERLVFSATGENLSDLKRKIFRGAWNGQTYDTISQTLGYNESYIKEEGANLCKLLSSVLGERVTKTSFRAAFERRQRLPDMATGEQPPAISVPPPPPVTGIDWSGSGERDTFPDLDSSLLGREDAITDLNHLVHQGTRLILIHGEGGIGKTTLSRYYFKTARFDLLLELWMATESQNITPVESVVEEWLRRDFNQDPGRDFGINLERLRRGLRDQSRKVGIFIDNLETALDGHGKFLEAHRSYVELLRVLTDPSVQSITVITSRERVYESSLNIHLYSLKGLSEPAWRQFFSDRQLDAASPALQEIWQAYGGNAKAMQILSGAILSDFAGDVEAYWHHNSNDLLIERELSDLVNSQFSRLQQVSPAAYALLCRMGCYRYQDVPSVPLQGVQQLLWDVPGHQHRQIIRSLQDLSLIESIKGQYWLHPVVRSQAIAHLRASDEWERVNRKAADFWTTQVDTVKNPQDALIALEAYYHNVEIEDFEAACNCLVQGRGGNTNERGLPLGAAFYQLGLLQKIISVITRIIHKINPDVRAMRLYNILGYTYRLMGQIDQALECHHQSRSISEAFQLDQAKISTLFNIGLCKAELWELENAKSFFNSVLLLAKQTPGCDEYGVYAQCCLAFLDSCLGLNQDASETIASASDALSSMPLTPWGKAYSLLFLGLTHKNLGNLQLSLELCNQTIFHTEEHHFTQVKAKAMNCRAEVYRQLQAFEAAISEHMKAIDLLDDLGAKCDLAEAYYQLGLTYQHQHNVEQSLPAFQTAIQLFEEINAPNQVEKVNKVLEDLSLDNYLQAPSSL